ncbi:CotH kinase family protein [Eubacteriales bacterium OttesenSCG-928-A19]|nr:CotH kinase family protein [Eubacteriales bacterium OttesenSCG-928-A19]
MRTRKTNNRTLHPSRHRHLLTVLILCLGMLSSLWAAAAQSQQVASSTAVSPVTQIPANLTQTFHALPSFTTHMPVLVLQMPSVAEESRAFFMEAGLIAYEGEEQNTLNALPAFSQVASIRNMTDKTNRTAQKSDFFLRFESPHHLLGMSASDEYILLGSGNDKSLIRNYIGYQIAAEIMENAPDFRLCEVFFRQPTGDVYQGVYLLVQKNTPDTSVLLHRGTSDEGISIETYATRHDSEVGSMYIPFMENTQWDARYDEVIGAVSTAENALYATNSATFYTYADLFDVPSFMARFILGELMEDYVAVAEGYYMYDTKTKLFSAAPLWNFDLALDNQSSDFADVTRIRYDEATYLDGLFKSPQFASQIQSTYLSLRRNALNEDALMRLVNEAVDYVSPAVQRDWFRWGAYAHHVLAPIDEVELEDGTVRKVSTFERQASTYEGEVVRLKYHLREHSLNMALNLTRFDFSEREISKEIVLNANPIWLLLFLVVFFSLVRFARKYGV